MKILDSQGRILGKFSILDLGAALVILLVIVGIFFFPGTSGSLAQVGVPTKPVEVDVVVRGLSIRQPQNLLKEFQTKKKTNVIIRNQPYGQVDVKAVRELPRTIIVPQPDGTAKAVLDPRQDNFSTDMLITLTGKAQITKNGPVLGNSKLKVGTPVELEGFDYNFNASVIDVRVKY
ncbi:pyruvate/2-oxoglutarate dehydrogenase complex,dihydrolipoamide dehydrogenase (E3) component [[Phormidium ambiguum] IAM M-71]|uniref:Pyruvate/2-oxoglutarate dehydrogenase complex,dihydrolipoamide dehydrogenase (E3) component n=1 Tax=[Phormidium ambiguum] IAM M-71 TaxID=454136 RepID=A0A1U7II19_9CYAN|nr:DUF4330 domain-containing protein [Phormidium ambiguum]OKH36703.1 pyruvate/2-oxoglutarate dehydrogenase complex,dihydrolipoamide dehydrogenase (E3) component [Phormidium ambiguum IAM M-71]